MPRSAGVETQGARGRWRRLLLFVLVGCAAAAVHWLCAVALIERGGLAPLWANVLGWMLALGVSFGGHYLWTFRGHGTPLMTAAGRFLFISATGFALNSTLYALLLRWDATHYDIWLAITLVLVAGLTYLLSHRWAFLRMER